MANLFDAENAPTVEPTEITPGDYIQWKRNGTLTSDYPPSTHTAEYVARISGVSDEIKVSGTAGSDHYLFTIDSDTSADFAVGHYYWQLEITETASGNRVVVDRGEFEAVADLDVNQSDPRSHAEILLGKIESLLSGRADADVASYSIAGRSLSKMTLQELLDARSFYQGEVKREKAEQDAKAGRTGSATIQVRF